MHKKSIIVPFEFMLISKITDWSKAECGLFFRFPQPLRPFLKGVSQCTINGNILFYAGCSSAP